MDEESYKKNFEFSKSCSNIIPTFGIHPWKITDKVPNLDIYGLCRNLYDCENLYTFINNLRFLS